MTGKTLSLLEGDSRNLVFLLDESLIPAVGNALNLVGYRFISTVVAFEKRANVKDPEVIEWAKSNRAVWVHADDSAKREHRKLILAAEIRTVWLYRRKGKMSDKEMLRALSFAMPEILERFDKHPARRHLKVSTHGAEPHPAIRVEDYDMLG